MLAIKAHFTLIGLKNQNQPKMEERKDFVSVNQAVEMMPPGVQVDRFLLYRERKRGKLNSYKFGGKIYFLRSDIEDYIKGAKETTTAN